MHEKAALVDKLSLSLQVNPYIPGDTYDLETI